MKRRVRRSSHLRAGSVTRFVRPVPAPGALFEALEPRKLLSADAAGVFQPFDLDANAPSGSVQTVDFLLQNPGDAPLNGTLLVDVFGITGDTFDPQNPGDAIFLGRTTLRGRVNPDADAEVQLKVTLPASMPAGAYRLAAVLDPDGKIAEQDEDNNVIISDVVEVTQPDYNLRVEFTNKTIVPSAQVFGAAGKGTASLLIINNGSAVLPKVAKAQVKVVARPINAVDDSQDIDLTSKPTFVTLNSLGAGKSKVQAVALTIPADLPVGEYDYLAIIDTNDDLAETSEFDNETPLDAPTLTVTDPFVDLSGALANPVIPTDLKSGDGTKLKLPIVITNHGNVDLARNATIDIQINLDNTGIGAEALQAVTTIPGVKVGGLKAGQSKTFTFTVEVPPGVPTDNYRVQILLDSNDDLDESDEGNNVIAGEDVIAVTEGNVDLQTAINSSTLPTAIVAGQKAKGRVAVQVTNGGDVKTGGTLAANLLVKLRPVGAVDDSQDITIGTLANQRLSGLAPTKSKTFNVNVEAPANVAVDDYQLVAVVNPANLNEPDTDNNTALGDIITVADPFVDLSGALANPTIPAALTSGDGTKLKLPVVITNNGNVDLARNATVDVQINLDSDGLGAGAIEAVTTLAGVKVGGLKAGQSKTFTFTVEVPPGVPTESYRVQILLDSNDDLDESDEGNNVITSVQTIAVTEGNVDLAAAINSTTLPPAVVAGQKATGKVAVQVTNDGNVKTSTALKLNVAVKLRPTDAVDDAQDITIGTLTNQSFAGVAPAGSKTFNVNVEVANTVPGDDYQLVAVVEAAGLTEPDTDNNTAVGTPVSVADPFVDLSGAFGNTTLPDALVSGDGTKIKLPIIITNNGNVALGRTATIDVQLNLTDEGVGPAALHEIITISNVKVGGLGAGKSQTLNATVEVPVGTPAGNYRIQALIDANDAVIEFNEGNNAVLTSDADLIAVALGEVTPVVTQDSTTLPAALVAGLNAKGKVVVRVLNDGNVKSPTGAKLDFTIVLRPTDAVDDAQDVVIGTLINQLFSAVAPDASKTFSVNVEVPANTPGDDYQIIIDMTPSGEADPEHFTGVGGSVTVASAFVDLAATVATTTFGNSVQSGAVGKGSVTFINNGNVPATGTVKAEFYATVGGNLQGATKIGESANVVVNKLAPGKTQTISNVNLTAPGVVVSSDYQIVAVINPAGLTDSNNANHTANAGNLNVTPIPPVFGLFTNNLTFEMLGNATNPIQGPFGGTQYSESGNFLDGAGRFGTYIFGIATILGTRQITLNLTVFSNFPTSLDSATLTITLPNNISSLDGRVLQFLTSAAGKNGTWTGVIASEAEAGAQNGNFKLT